MSDEAITLRPGEPQRGSPADDWVNPALHLDPELEIPVSTFVAPAVPAPPITAPAPTAPDAVRSLDDDLARIPHLADAGNWSEAVADAEQVRTEEHKSERKSLMRTSYGVVDVKKTKHNTQNRN